MPDPKLRDYIPALECILGMILFVTGGGICVDKPGLIPALVGLAGLALCGWVLRSNKM